MSLRNATVGTKLMSLNLFFSLVFIAFGGWAWMSMKSMSVDGPTVSQLLSAKDLVADILPPPAYIIESHLLTLEMESMVRSGRSAESLRPLVDRAAKLKAEFISRRDHWRNTLPDGQAKDLLLKEAGPLAEEYFRIRDEQFIPACMTRRIDEASQLAFGPLAQKYGDHRAKIDQLVVVATDIQKDAMTRVENFFSSTMTWMIAAIVLALGANITTGYLITRQIIGTLRSSARSMHVVADQSLGEISRRMRGNASETSHQATLASGAAEQVSANAQTLATALSQFEVSIREISSNATKAAAVARSAVNATERTTQTVSQLGSSSNEIGNVIKVINSIAEQTNLLALNATIEAARAGDAGKGFAVVANEVKELAKQTSVATEDIIRRINAIQSDTTDAIDAIGHVSEIIGQISESQNAIATAVEEQSAMTAEIARNISEVAIGSGEIAKNIASVADAASSTSTATDETVQAASEIDGLAAELLAMVGEVRDEVANSQRGARTVEDVNRNSRPRTGSRS